MPGTQWILIEIQIVNAVGKALRGMSPFCEVPLCLGPLAARPGSWGNANDKQFVICGTPVAPTPVGGG